MRLFNRNVCHFLWAIGDTPKRQGKGQSRTSHPSLPYSQKPQVAQVPPGREEKLPAIHTRCDREVTQIRVGVGIVFLGVSLINPPNADPLALVYSP